MPQRAGIVGAGAAHEPERVHRPWRATRKGVETREDLYELAAGRARSRPRGLALRVRRVERHGPHPLGALVGIGLPCVGRLGNRLRLTLAVYRPESRTFRKSCGSGNTR